MRVSMDRAMTVWECRSSYSALKTYHLFWATVFVASVPLLWLELYKQSKRAPHENEALHIALVCKTRLECSNTYHLIYTRPDLLCQSV